MITLKLPALPRKTSFRATVKREANRARKLCMAFLFFVRLRAALLRPRAWPTRPCPGDSHVGEQGLQHGAIAIVSQPRQTRMTKSCPFEDVETETGAILHAGRCDTA